MTHSCCLNFPQGILAEVERICTVDLIVLTSSDQLLLALILIFLYKTSYLSERSIILSLPLQ
jgi:hypothetical protein